MKLSIGIKSLGVQTLSLLLCFICLILLNKTFGFTASPILFLIGCGALAAILSVVFKFDWWWSVIQLLFPLILYLAYQLNIPPVVYFGALLVCALVFWSTYRTQVPYFPSRSVLAEPISELLGEFEYSRFVDVGSGFGGLLFQLEELRANSEFTGIEIAPLPYCYSQWRRIYRGSKVKFLFGSYFDLDFGHFDVVFCYLSPVAMPDLWRKASFEMKKGSMLLSYEFIIPDVSPSFTLDLNDGGPLLHGWRI